MFAPVQILRNCHEYRPSNYKQPWLERQGKHLESQLTLGQTTSKFHPETDCTAMHAVGQHSDLAHVNRGHQTVTHHGRCVAVAAQNLQRDVKCHWPHHNQITSSAVTIRHLGGWYLLTVTEKSSKRGPARLSLIAFMITEHSNPWLTANFSTAVFLLYIILERFHLHFRLYIIFVGRLHHLRIDLYSMLPEITKYFRESGRVPDLDSWSTVIFTHKNSYF